MSYNLGMDQLTLVIPHSLTPQELAKDLARALPAPALAMLLTRHSACTVQRQDDDARVLPHEAWLARALGAAAPGQAPLAAAAMRGCGLPPAPGHWFIVQPVHVQLARTHMVMADPRELRLEAVESRALFDAVQPYFEELGKPLLYGGAATWFVRADDWRALVTASPDAAVGANLTDWMPDGDGKRAFRMLQNEVQMLWHEHPVNEARQARGLPPVNSFWLWGGADAGSAHAAAPAAGPAGLAVSGAPEWLAALADPARRAPQPAALLAEAGDATVVLGELAAPAMAEDWSAWLMRMQAIERDWLAPALAALRDGRVGRIRLVLSDRGALADFTITKGALRKFWRKPTLDKLSP